MDINERLLRLEHENQRLAQQTRQLKSALALILVLALGGAALLLPCGCGGRTVADEGQSTVSTVQTPITTRGINIVDSNGKLVAALGEKGLRILDEQGTLRVLAAKSGVFVADENQKVRAHLHKDGLVFQDENEKKRSAINKSGVGFHDEEGALRCVLVKESLTIKDKKGQRRVELSEDGVATYHPTGEPATALLGAGEVAVWGDNGKVQARLNAEGVKTER